MSESCSIDELRKHIRYRNGRLKIWIIRVIAVLSIGSLGWALRSILVR